MDDNHKTLNTCHSEKATPSFIFCIRPTKNFSFPLAQSFFFQLQVRFDDRCPQEKRDCYFLSYNQTAASRSLSTNWHKYDGVIWSGLKGRYISAQGNALGQLIFPQGVALG
jgi:hypothetical protein